MHDEKGKKNDSDHEAKEALEPCGSNKKKEGIHTFSFER